MENITNELHIQAQTRPDVIALCLTNATYTFNEFNEIVWRTATYLSQSGLKPGNVVAILCRNELTIFATMLALARIGVTTVVRKWPSTQGLTEELALLNIDNVIVDGAVDLPSSCRPLVLTTTQLLDKSLPIDYHVYIKEPLEPFLISSGSGTTGKPKLIPINHAQVRARMNLIFAMEKLQVGDRIATLSDIEFTSTQFRALAALCVGATAVLVRDNILTLIETFGVTHLGALLHQLEDVLEKISDEEVGVLGSLKSLSIGFTTISSDVRTRIRRKLCENLYVGYGANECGAVSMAGPPNVFDSAGTVGFPLPGVEVEIVDANRQLLPAGSVGQVRIKSPGMITGYLHEVEANAKAFHDGWFYPGDNGCLTADGQLIHMGRTDDMMIMNGINIYPAEIEQTIVRHPDVLDAVAMSIKSPVHHDIPICVVVLQPNATISEQALIDFCQQYIDIRAPKRVISVASIPRNEQGKLKRKALQALIEELETPFTRPPWPKKILMRKYGQHAHTFSITMDRELFGHLGLIDKWLKQVLVIDLATQPVSTVVHHGHEKIMLVVGRVCLLAKTLLNVISIPVFDPIEILKLDTTAEKQFGVIVAIPQVNHVPLQLFSKALHLAATLILKFMQRPITPENTQQLFARLDKNFIKPFMGVAGSGKSTMPILQAAHRLGIPFYHYSNGCYQLGWGSKSMMINRSATELDSSLGSILAQNKSVTAKILKDAGLPTPEQHIVVNVEQAGAAAEKLGWPVVVKPLDSDRGEGVTVDVTDHAGLHGAFNQALDVSSAKQVIVEKQVEGVCCRVFIANEQMLYAVKRLPKSVRGNGNATVGELITMANQRENALPPWRRSEPFPADKMAVAAMERVGANLNSVPQFGQLIPLRRIESTESGGVDEDVTMVIHPDNIELALRAVRLFKLNIAGIDIITPDISEPWWHNGAIVNEVNFSPHYGWGAIARSTIPTYLRSLVQDDGRIPVTVIVGAASAMAAALKIQQDFLAKGLQAYVSSHQQSFTPMGNELHFAFSGLYPRCRALLVDARVEALILVVQNGELLERGLPVDAIDCIIVDSKTIQVRNNSDTLLSAQDFEALLQLLKTAT